MIVFLSEEFLEGYDGLIIFQNCKWTIKCIHEEVEFYQFGKPYHAVELELYKEEYIL